MLSLESFNLAVLGFQVCVNSRLVGVIVGKSRMYLRQRQVACERLYDLFRNQAHVVPLSDPANRNTRPGNARPAAANLGAPGDQAAYLSDGSHGLQYNAPLKSADPERFHSYGIRSHKHAIGLKT